VNRYIEMQSLLNRINSKISHLDYLIQLAQPDNLKFATNF